MEAPAKRRTRSGTYAQGLLALAFLLSGCRNGETDLVLVGTVERTLIELVAPVAETIESLAVERGARVERDGLVVQLDPTLPQADLARAEAAVEGCTEHGGRGRGRPGPHPDPASAGRGVGT